MISPIKILFATGMVVSAGHLVQAADGFDRYQVILEREPFGAPPPEPEAPPGPPTEEEPPWAKTYRLCSVYESNSSEVQVALLDTRTNKPVMLTLGDEPVEGIELLSANIAEEEAVLQKDGLQVTMKLEASKTPAPKPKVTKGPTPTPAQIAARNAAANRRTSSSTSSSGRRGVIRAVRQ